MKRFLLVSLMSCMLVGQVSFTDNEMNFAPKEHWIKRCFIGGLLAAPACIATACVVDKAKHGVFPKLSSFNLKWSAAPLGLIACASIVGPSIVSTFDQTPEHKVRAALLGVMSTAGALITTGLHYGYKKFSA